MYRLQKVDDFVPSFCIAIVLFGDKSGPLKQCPKQDIPKQ
jgi:hypothetical protein